MHTNFARALGVSFFVGAVVVVLIAVFHERMMHRHRRPGVSYWSATLRRDGGWRRSDLFDEQGLAHQRRAATWAMTASVFLLLGFLLLAANVAFRSGGL
jgi:hypothetical protein